MRSIKSFIRAPFWGFAAFGAFWGVWGASIPRIREQAEVSDSELGVALLFVGAGALPAMLLAGRALDRFGLWLTGPLLLALGLAGSLVALTAGGGLVVLCIGFALVGATSGAADVAMNSLAGRAEQRSKRSIITPAHATFSSLVVVATLSAGAMSALQLPILVPFALMTAAAAVACVAIVRSARQTLPEAPHAADDAVSSSRMRSGMPATLLIGIGFLGALAFATENAHQSWGALFLEDELSVSLGLSAFGPAVFAGIVAITRFSVSRVGPQHARTLLILGAVAATVGTAGLALAPNVALALLALAIAAAGTAVLFPTLLGIVSRTVTEERRARVTSLVTVIAYTGFLAGPPYVGLLAGALDLRGAMLGVAALTAVMAVLIPIIIRGRGRKPTAPALVK